MLKSEPKQYQHFNGCLVTIGDAAGQCTTVEIVHGSWNISYLLVTGYLTEHFAKFRKLMHKQRGIRDFLNVFDTKMELCKMLN